MIYLANGEVYSNIGKGYWVSKRGNCYEPVQFFHSKQSSIEYDVRFFSAQIALHIDVDIRVADFMMDDTIVQSLFAN